MTFPSGGNIDATGVAMPAACARFSTNPPNATPVTVGSTVVLQLSTDGTNFTPVASHTFGTVWLAKAAHIFPLACYTVAPTSTGSPV